MNFKPILFSTPMVQAILAGRKTMTRRIIKKKYSNTDIEWRKDKYGTQLVEMQNDVPGQMSVNRLTIAGMKRNGVFVEIENVLQLTTERNRAMTIHELSVKYGITPIELINRICKK